MPKLLDMNKINKSCVPCLIWCAAMLSGAPQSNTICGMC